MAAMPQCAALADPPLPAPPRPPPHAATRVCDLTGKKANNGYVVTFSHKRNKKLQHANLQYKKIYWPEGQRCVGAAERGGRRGVRPGGRVVVGSAARPRGSGAAAARYSSGACASGRRLGGRPRMRHARWPPPRRASLLPPPLFPAAGSSCA